MRQWFKVAAIAVIAVTLVACGKPTKRDILAKAESVGTKAELEQAIGKPDSVSKLGPLESWTYTASNGEVVFLIAGNTVTLQMTGKAE